MSGNTADDSAKYSIDKPQDCKFCYYWQGRKKGCLMGEQNCAYLIREEAPAEHGRCVGCTYGRYSLCIGWCTVDVINAVFKNRLAARADQNQERSP